MNSRGHTGELFADPVEIDTGGCNNIVLHIIEGAATAGTVTLLISPPGETEQFSYANNLYTIGSGGG